eukprot:PhM_4_TR4836/c0_g2_i1/m.71683
MKRTHAVFVRYQPYALALQVRFRWRHKENDQWRRLMDASCFVVDWITRPTGAPTLSQYGGHWCHIVTCAHVMCPWDYPIYYPPLGATKFVSRITPSDTMLQLRVPDLQGDVIHKHFTSRHHSFQHSNPRLDIAVCHSEQNYKRYGEMKMLWMQNEGWAMRPRLDVLTELKAGDSVWLYGMNAQENLLDDDKKPDITMIPTGVRGIIRGCEEEHFWVAFDDVIPMGMCGGPVMKDGKCVGMLTALAHSDSENRTLAGCGMCTYSRDIRSFLIEVEKQMKNPNIKMYNSEGQWEGKHDNKHKDWSSVEGRLARHIEVPISNTRIDQHFVEGDRQEAHAMFGRSGLYDQETQENFMGMDMSSSTVAEKPENVIERTPDGEKRYKMGERPDKGFRRGVYGVDEDFKNRKDFDVGPLEDVKEMFKGVTREQAGKDPDMVAQLRQVQETHTQMRRSQQNTDSAKRAPEGTYFKNFSEFAKTGGSPFGDKESIKETRARSKDGQTATMGYDSNRTQFSDDNILSGLWDKH